MDAYYKNTPSMGIFMMEELFEKGCASPLLYMKAWKWVSRDMTLLHRLSSFWIQVFCYAGKRDLLTEELVMRMAYLSGYEKSFSGALYRAMTAGYEKFPSDDVLEAICKYVMKGNPRNRNISAGFPWRWNGTCALQDCMNIMWRPWTSLIRENCPSLS